MNLSTISPFSSVAISSVRTGIRTRKSCNLSTICSHIPPSLGLHCDNGRSHSNHIFTDHRFITACTQTESDSLVVEGVGKFGDIFWRFLRPHVLLATVVASSCLFLRVLMESPNLIQWSLVSKALSGVFAIACANSYSGGLNQIYDIEIDRINKPYYPIASGDISVKSAWLLVLLFAGTGLSVVGTTCGPFISCLYIVALFLATVYSIPPIRLKKSPLGAIFCISFVIGFLLNFAVYYSTKIALGLPFQWSAPLVFITVFGTVATGVLGIIKDLPDVEGDSKFGIPTLAITIGVRNVAYLGCGLLVLFNVASIVAAIYMPQVLRCSLIIPMHLISTLSLIYQTRLLEQANYAKEASERFYKFTVILYFIEYIMFLFI